MSSDPAIVVDGVSKSYNIYATPQDRLKQAVVPRLQRWAGPVTSALGYATAPRMFYRQHWALRDISFAVGRGETVGVIGRNGSGKSTLLQLICGTLKPSAGEIRVSGRVGALLELGAGFDPERTGRQNVFLNGTVLGLSYEQLEARLDDILAFADIGPFIEEPVKTYSSGMTMRLAFAVIAHVDADILIIDEALAVGDAYFQQKCMRWLRRFRESGTVLFCGHDTGAVLSLCDHAVWLDAGHLRAQGGAKEVCEAYLASISAQVSGLADQSVRPARARRGEATAGEAEAAEPAVPGLGALPQEVKVFELNPDTTEFGSGDATITDVQLTKADGSALTLIRGGEDVLVTVRARVNADIEQPVIGFFVKNRLGQPLFGDNTSITYPDHGPVAAGEELVARFRFDLPLLLTGDYSITAAIASGRMEEHVMHHWLHDALLFQVRSPLLTGVFVGIPMTGIELVRRSAPAESAQGARAG